MRLMYNRFVPWIAAFVLVSWLGEYIHNRYELPQLTLLSPENSLPALISILLLFAWWLSPMHRLTTSVLLGWTLLHLVGGAILSVIPFSFLPFYPPQTLPHYLSHVLYGLAQLPLIISLLLYLKSLSNDSLIVRQSS